MDREDLRRRLRDILATVNEELASAGEITEETSLQDGLGLDSLQIAELLFEIEEQLGVRISDEQARQLATVGQLLDTIQRGLERPDSPAERDGAGGPCVS